MDLITTQIVDDVAVVPGPAGRQLLDSDLESDLESDDMHKTGEQNMLRLYMCI